MNARFYIKGIISVLLLSMFLIIPKVYATTVREYVGAWADPDGHWFYEVRVLGAFDGTYTVDFTTDLSFGHSLLLSGFGFAVPDNAILDSIKVGCRGVVIPSGFNVPDLIFKFSCDGSSQSDGIHSVAVETKEFTLNAFLLGKVSVADLNDENFVAEIYSGVWSGTGAGTVYCDGYYIEVEYHVPSLEEWHDIATWNFKLNTREWTYIEKWLFNLECPSPEIYFPIGPILFRLGIFVTLNAEPVDKVNITISGGPSNFTFWKMTDSFGEAIVRLKKGTYLFYISHDIYLVEHKISIVKHCDIYFELNSTEYIMVRDWTTEIIEIVSGTSCFLALLAIYAYHEQKTVSKQWKKIKSLKGKPKKEIEKLKGKR